MSQKHTTDFPVKDFLAPIYWPTWLGLGLLRASSYLPYGVLIRLGTALGWLGFYLLPVRRRITRTNVRLAFPELDKQAQNKIIKKSFYSASIALFESALAWWAPDEKLKAMLTIEDEEYQKVVEQGQGFLVLGGHYTTVELAGRLISFAIPNVYLTYKPAHNKLFEAVMSRARRRYSAGLIPSSDLRGILRQLRKGNRVWIAPDQDFGMRHSVFAPFMGIQTATLTVMSRLAERAHCPVVPAYHERLPGNEGYRIHAGKPLENFPSGDDVVDTSQINAAIEQQVKAYPDQYLWGHRRFKTRPHGEPLFYKPRRDSALKKYSLLLGLITIPVIFYTAWQAWRHKDKQHFTERLGLANYSKGPFDIWIHAASVGEVNAVLPLVEILAQRHPHLSLIFTANTPTGAMTARKKLPANMAIHYMPIDLQLAVERFTEKVKPRAVLITETEVWPNLYLHCFHKGIHLTIINGRLSDKILLKSTWIKRVYGRALEEVYWILARSEQDRDNFLAIGAKDQYMKVVGNIKFSITKQNTIEPFLSDRPYVLAASTREGEERLIAECWKKLAPEKRFLIIAPRHPKRLSQILRDLKPLDLNIAVRSRNEPLTERTQIYLADTFGELNQFIAGSQFVIMGGSLKPFGGQNILEVAREGKGVVFGPYMENFSNEASLFVQHDAGLQVKNEAELCATIARLLSNPERADALGEQGSTLMTEAGDIAERYLEELEKLLPIFQSSTPAE